MSVQPLSWHSWKRPLQGNWSGDDPRAQHRVVANGQLWRCASAAESSVRVQLLCACGESRSRQPVHVSTYVYS